jgi:hypothetical protein
LKAIREGINKRLISQVWGTMQYKGYDLWWQNWNRKSGRFLSGVTPETLKARSC